ARGGELVERAPVLEVLPPGESPVQAALAAEHDADQRPDGARLLDDVVPENARPSRSWHEHGRQDLDQRRLAGAVRAEQPVDLTVRNLDGDAGERGGRRVGLAPRLEDPRDFLDDDRLPLHGPQSWMREWKTRRVVGELMKLTQSWFDVVST